MRKVQLRSLMRTRSPLFVTLGVSLGDCLGDGTTLSSVVLGATEWGKRFVSVGEEVSCTSVTGGNNGWEVGAEVTVGVVESVLADNFLEVVGNSLEWGLAGDGLGDVVVGTSKAGVLNSSWDLSNNLVVLSLEFLAVEGLLVNSGAVHSVGHHGLG